MRIHVDPVFALARIQDSIFEELFSKHVSCYVLRRKCDNSTGQIKKEVLGKVSVQRWILALGGGIPFENGTGYLSCCGLIGKAEDCPGVDEPFSLRMPLR